ncbi:hypothetical protein GGI23_005733 [Coemansia sp. RSA 2559]|nr:hypothetical protein GGI23_005733 [Coemansia sp. RSA 2559]KAJ2846724.1 hypothetical protein GGI22_006171 [Coemansia erecta]
MMVSVFAATCAKPKFLLALVALTSAITLASTYYYVLSTGDRQSDTLDFPDSTNTVAPKPPLPYAAELSSLNSAHAVPEHITTTIFMFRGDFSSPLFDLFTLQKRAIKFCDNDTKAEGCDIHLARSYKWETLSSKLVDSLETMCKSMKRTDFYVKIDDDLIMSESKLEEVIRKMATTDCQVAGGIAVDYPFYWPVGQIYIFKRAIFDAICRKLPTPAKLYSSEDITFGMLLNSTNTNMFCSLDEPKNHWHKHYSDQRVKIDYLQQHNE